MTDYKIPIDTFVRETFECKASVCAILTGAALSFQDVKLQSAGTRQSSTSSPEVHYFPFRLPVF